MDAPHRNNNVGAFRLLFALLVVAAHTPELMDGDRGREPLTMVFHTLSFGELAVDGFFLISGYLITQSWLAGGGPASYLWRRFLRIYPGFLVAFVLTLAIAPLLGAQFGGVEAGVRNLFKAMLLQEPRLEGGPAALNGSMWTLAYEFRCYVLVAVVGAFGGFRRPAPVAAVALGLLLAILIVPDVTTNGMISAVVGDLRPNVRFTAMFATGAAYMLLKDRIPWRPGLAMIALLLLIGGLFTPAAEPVLGVFGGYALFWTCFHLRCAWLSKVNTTCDLSYGVYLYAWPVTLLAIAMLPSLAEPWAMSLLVAAASAALAYLSWTFVERPALELRRLVPTRRGVAAA